MIDYIERLNACNKNFEVIRTTAISYKAAYIERERELELLCLKLQDFTAKYKRLGNKEDAVLKSQISELRKTIRLKRLDFKAIVGFRNDLIASVNCANHELSDVIDGIKLVIANQKKMAIPQKSTNTYNPMFFNSFGVNISVKSPSTNNTLQQAPDITVKTEETLESIELTFDTISSVIEMTFDKNNPQDMEAYANLSSPKTTLDITDPILQARAGNPRLNSPSSSIEDRIKGIFENEGCCAKDDMLQYIVKAIELGFIAIDGNRLRWTGGMGQESTNSNMKKKGGSKIKNKVWLAILLGMVFGIPPYWAGLQRVFNVKDLWDSLRQVPYTRETEHKYGGFLNKIFGDKWAERLTALTNCLRELYPGTCV